MNCPKFLTCPNCSSQLKFTPVENSILVECDHCHAVWEINTIYTQTREENPIDYP